MAELLRRLGFERDGEKWIVPVDGICAFVGSLGIGYLIVACFQR